VAIASCIKQSLKHSASAYTVIRDAGYISGEYMGVRTTEQVTKPITMEHFRVADIPYDTSATTGDVIEIDASHERFMVTNLAPIVMGNALALYQGILYKCNIQSGELYRPSGETWGVDYHKETQWSLVKNSVHAMHVAALYGADLSTDKELAMIGLAKDEVYMPDSVGIQALDRWQPASGEYYLVETVERRRYPGVDVAVVVEDTR